MTVSSKYAVVMLSEGIPPGENPYKCVPKTWLKFQSYDQVILPYPPAEQLPLSMDLLINYSAPVLSWPSYAATFIGELDTYEQGLFLIRHLDDGLFEEWVIIKWRKISDEVRQRQRRRQSVFLKLWKWFLSFLID